MPKLPHEALVQLVRTAPELVTRLLHPLFDDLPSAPIEVLPQVTATELVNLDLPEHRADVVLLFGDPQRPREAIVVEVQSEPDPRKRRTWPFYVTGFGVRFNCPVTLVVLTLDDDVAAWCRTPIDFGRGRGFLHPVAIGPRDVPKITDPEAAAAAPELAVLSVIAHGRSPGAESIAYAALSAAQRLDTQAGIHYADFIEAFLGDVARVALRQLMQQKSDNPFFSELFSTAWSSGKSEGFADGEARGRVEGKTRSLLKMFRLRMWTPPAEIEARVLACQDEAQVDLWIERVLTVATLDEVFV